MDTVAIPHEVETPGTLPAVGAMSRGRVLRAYAIETKYESLRMLRSPGFAGPFLLLPVGLYLLFGSLLYGPAIAKDPKTALFLFIGFAVMGVMGPGIFGFGVNVATEREHGLLQLKRALPMPPAAVFLARMLMAMLFVAIVMASLAAAAPVGHLHIPAARLFAVSLVGIAGSLPFCALGFFAGSLASAKSAPAFVNVFYIPMIYLSEILFPLPKSMEWVAHLSPAYHLDQIALRVLGAPAEGALGIHLAVLCAITVAFTAFAVRRLARHG